MKKDIKSPVNLVLKDAPNPMFVLKDVREKLREGTLKSFTPLLNLFRWPDGSPLTLQNHYQIAPFYDVMQPKKSIYLCARQVAKSYNITTRAILTTGLIPGFSSMIMQPRHDQARRYNSQVLLGLMEKCCIIDRLISRTSRQGFLLKKFYNNNLLMLEHAFTNPDRIRGASGLATVYIDEAQDFSSDSFPVIEATAVANIDYGFIFYTGTAKTSDNVATTLFNQSSQGHWCVPCSCGKKNIASIDQDLLKMIGKKGCSCAKCGKVVNVRAGYYVHAYPGRINDFAGRHISMITTPIHCEYEHMWRQLLLSIENSPTKALYYNEILGVPCDESVKLLTLQELLTARNKLDNSIQKALSVVNRYSMILMGVDWSGGGGLGHSYTVITIMGKQSDSAHCDVLYILRLGHGLSPEEEIHKVGELARAFNVSILAHDYTGAGFVRESLLVSLYPDLSGLLFPITYVYRPRSDLVTPIASGSRASYAVDKTRSLLLTITAIRHMALTVPYFDAGDENAPQRDLLALNEEAKETNRGSSYYLINRTSDRSDDTAHAINIAFIACCHIHHDYPVLGGGCMKFIPDADTLHDLTGEESPQ